MAANDSGEMINGLVLLAAADGLKDSARKVFRTPVDTGYPYLRDVIVTSSDARVVSASSVILPTTNARAVSRSRIITATGNSGIRSVNGIVSANNETAILGIIMPATNNQIVRSGLMTYRPDKALSDTVCSRQDTAH